MGYACPVCDAVEADGEHLANHLAFTALLHGGEHEAWLDDHVPDWADRDPERLAPAVTEHAPEREVPDAGSATETGTDLEDAVARQSGRGRGAGDLDDETRAVLEEAAELTEAMLEGDGDGAETDSDGTKE